MNRCVIRDDVNDNSDVVGVKSAHQLIEIIECSQTRIHISLVIDVVTAIGQM